MLLEVNKKVALDLTNDQRSGWQKRHIDVKQYFLGEFKEEGLLWIKNIRGDENNADQFWKNLSGPTFKNMYNCTLKLISVLN